VLEWYEVTVLDSEKRRWTTMFKAVGFAHAEGLALKMLHDSKSADKIIAITLDCDADS